VIATADFAAILRSTRARGDEQCDDQQGHAYGRQDSAPMRGNAHLQAGLLRARV
jgi:hypothetical protein